MRGAGGWVAEASVSSSTHPYSTIVNTHNPNAHLCVEAIAVKVQDDAAVVRLDVR